MENSSFLGLFENFDSAKSSDNPNVATLAYQGFIQLLPTETITQITNSTTPIAFAGAIQVDLIDNCGNLVENIDNNFAYQSFVDSKGIEQISFEFGFIATDYYTRTLYLRITDLVNGNIFYSNGFLNTNYQSELSSRFIYFSEKDFDSIEYSLAPFKQSIRFAKCFDFTPVNEKNLKQYNTSQGKRVNYRNTTTYLRKYNFDAFDYSINDRFEVLISHPFVYLDNERVVLNDFKIEERKGDTNVLTGEFIVNKQGEKITLGTQLLQSLTPLVFTPSGTLSSIGVLYTFNLTFNRNIVLNDSSKKIFIYKGSTLFETITNFDVVDNVLSFINTINITDADTYSIKIEKGLIKSILNEDFEITNFTDWSFELKLGVFNNAQFNNTQFLVN